MEYLNNKYVSTALGLVLVSNLYEFSPKMPLIIRRYKNNIVVQFIMVFLFCLLLIKDIHDALLISIVYMALFFIMDKMEGFDDDSYSEDYEPEYLDEEEYFENFANNVKQEIHHHKKHSHKNVKTRHGHHSHHAHHPHKTTKMPKNPKSSAKITFTPKNLALLKTKEEKHKKSSHKNHHHHKELKEHFGSCSNNRSGLIPENNISYFDDYSSDYGVLQGVEAFEANVMNLNEF